MQSQVPGLKFYFLFIFEEAMRHCVRDVPSKAQFANVLRKEASSFDVPEKNISLTLRYEAFLNNSVLSWEYSVKNGKYTAVSLRISVEIH